MYEHILEDDVFFGVVGILECWFSVPSWHLPNILPQMTRIFQATKPTTAIFSITLPNFISQ